MRTRLVAVEANTSPSQTLRRDEVSAFFDRSTGASRSSRLGQLPSSPLPVWWRSLACDMIGRIDL